MRRIFFVAIAVLFVCGTAYAQINEGIGEAESMTFVFGYQGQSAGGSVNAGVHYPLTYAYADGIGGDEVLDIPLQDWAEIHEWGEFEEIPDHIHIDGQVGFLMGIADPEAALDNAQVDAEGHFMGWQGQEQVNVAHAGAESVHAETYQGMEQFVYGGAYDEGYANAFAYGFNEPQPDVFAGAVTISVGDPTNVGAAFAGFEIDGGIAVGAGAVAEDPGLLTFDEELGEEVYVDSDHAFAASEAWVGAYAAYSNTVNSATFASVNMGWTASDINVYAAAVATGLPGDEENVMYATIFGVEADAFSGGGIAIQADSDSLGMAGGTGMYAGIYDAYWSTEGEFGEGGNGSVVGIDINQESYFYASAINVTNTGYQTAFQEFSADQHISFQAKNGSVNLPD